MSEIQESNQRQSSGENQVEIKAEKEIEIKEEKEGLEMKEGTEEIEDRKRMREFSSTKNKKVPDNPSGVFKFVTPQRKYQRYLHRSLHKRRRIISIN